MRVGIVGFSQSGKSTLFQVLTGVHPEPAAVMKGQVGITHVEDERLDFLADLYSPKKKTPAVLEFVDTPGLLREDHADNPHRIATLRNADGLLVVLDGFSGAENAERQLVSFREELYFADLGVVAARIHKLTDAAKKPKPAPERERDAHELAELQVLAGKLEAMEPVALSDLAPETEKLLRSFQLFSTKPELVVLNVSERQLAVPLDEGLRRRAPDLIATAAKLELDLEGLDEADRQLFMAELGVTELARPRIIRQAFAAMGMISFFTVGEDECKAWPIRQGTPAVEAAGKIHSDIARGFIRAELCRFDDLRCLGSMKEVKTKGLARLEGKEYLVRDGDVINFRFSV